MFESIRSDPCFILAQIIFSVFGTTPTSQESVSTPENGSQPDNYTLEGWLARYGLDMYLGQLEAAGFGTPQVFSMLNDEDLTLKVKVFDKCHRMTLLHASQRVLMRRLAG